MVSVLAEDFGDEVTSPIPDLEERNVICLFGKEFLISGLVVLSIFGEAIDDL